MAAIVKAEGITDVEEAAFDLWWRAPAGSMRRLMATMDLLKTKHAGKRVTEKTIQELCDVAQLAVEIAAAGPGPRHAQEPARETPAAHARTDGFSLRLPDGTLREVALTLRDLGLPDRMAAATALWQDQIGSLALPGGPDDLADRADHILGALR
jgi:hypothetical protein